MHFQIFLSIKVSSTSVGNEMTRYFDDSTTAHLSFIYSPFSGCMPNQKINKVSVKQTFIARHFGNAFCFVESVHRHYGLHPFNSLSMQKKKVTWVFPLLTHKNE